MAWQQITAMYIWQRGDCIVSSIELVDSLMTYQGFAKRRCGQRIGVLSVIIARQIVWAAGKIHTYLSCQVGEAGSIPHALGRLQLRRAGQCYPQH